MITFFAPGVPATKGSARAFVVNGRAVVTNNDPRAKGWASTISLAARFAMDGASPIGGPVAVRIDFYLPRPKAHYTKRGLRSSAPVYVATKPDVDKVLRCALDALTAIVFRDDSQIVACSARKLYAGEDQPPGAWISVRLAVTAADDSELELQQQKR